jgi:tert-butyl alcohol monooxygenase / tert-amyl alcohol desaturase
MTSQHRSLGRLKTPYGGYHVPPKPNPDLLCTSTKRGTPMGEYMRRFWQPVCLSEELKELPKAIQIMGEELVAFRDRSGRIGVLHRQCSHRGASLEYGIVQLRGIRCCYHGWHFDVDGRVLETPCEPATSKIKETLCQGAYPAFERHGLVFAYLGPPDAKPSFPEFDSYTLPADTRLVAFSNVYPCNWLQVCENVMDHMHTAVLHNRMTVEGVDDAIASGLSLQGFGDMPTMHWAPVRGGSSMVFVAGRRLPGNKAWIRITEMSLPNYIQAGSFAPSASRQRHSTTSLTRWHVPVDDENMLMFGWRHFNEEVDPDGVGRPEACGVDKVDFLDGQSGDRTYEEGQRAPGDFEAITSQGRIANHALENPGTSDAGVYMFRKLLRNAMGSAPAVPTSPAPALRSYAQDSVLTMPKSESPDSEVLLDLGKLVLAIAQEADALPSQDRDSHIRRRLDEIDGGW